MGTARIRLSRANRAGAGASLGTHRGRWLVVLVVTVLVGSFLPTTPVTAQELAPEDETPLEEDSSVEETTPDVEEPPVEEPPVEEPPVEEPPVEEPPVEEPPVEESPVENTTDDAVVGPLSVGPGGTRVKTDNTFYAYVGAGENVDVSFLQTLAGARATDVVITVRRPGEAPLTCTRLATDPEGSACTWTDLTAGSSGIWQIDFDPAGDVTDYYSWEIDVQSGATSIDGRVFSERYGMAQRPEDTTDVNLWYQSEQGFLYEATYAGYNGVNSGFASDATGVAEPGSCVSAYQSTQQAGTGGAFWTPVFDDPGQCGDRYKIFFEEPDATLPATATLWDGTSVWLRPPVSLPVLSNLAFTRTDPSATAGEFTFDVENFTGQLDVLVDVNDDGDYTDPEDRTVPAAVSQDGTVTVAFDGVDGLGDTIPPTQSFNARVAITRTGEIHFVNGDVETRDGLTVQALNGPDSGSTTIYWDDTNLDPTGRIGTIPPADGTGGVDSSTGVHGWTCSPLAECNANTGSSGSWGDTRNIDDWTYHTIDEAVEIAVPGETLPPFECAVNAPGLLFQHQYPPAAPPTTARSVQMITGAFAPELTIDDRPVNAVGYNVVDNYVYGWDFSAGEIVKVGSDGNTEGLGVPDGHEGVATNQIIGDVDDQGHFWYAHPGIGRWHEVDLNEGSPTYMTVLNTGVIDPWPSSNDWAYVPGTDALYSIGEDVNGNDTLLRFDRSTHTFTDEVPLGIGDAIDSGAMYADPDGHLYTSNNAGGAIHRVDVDAGTAEFFADGPESGGNDGARCASSPLAVDFGDAPASYGTLLADAGPRHAIPNFDPGANTAPVMLGSLIDIETDGQPNADADGDDTTGVADEDGVVFNSALGYPEPTLRTGLDPSSLQPVSNTLEVEASADGFVSVWVDWNVDGDFDDPGEQVASAAAVTAGMNDITFAQGTNPPGISTYVRVRYSTDDTAIADPTGPAPDGEVEDYQVLIERLNQPDTCAVGDSEYYALTFSSPVTSGTTGGAGDTARYENITVVNGVPVDMVAEVVSGQLNPTNALPNGFTVGDGSPMGTDDAQWQVDGNARLRFSFYEAGTTNPVAMNGVFTVNDLDGVINESVTLTEADLADWAVTQGSSVTISQASGLITFHGDGAWNGDPESRFQIVLEGISTFESVWRGSFNSGFGFDGDGDLSIDPPACEDFGDAPDTYGTTLADDGARHTIVDGLFLGSEIDFDPDGRPGVDADGDDVDRLADEDGVDTQMVLFRDQPTTVSVDATNTTGDVATLAGWIDLNDDGDFDDAGELQSVVVPSGGAGSYDLTFDPATFAGGGTFARFRLFPGDIADADLSPTGPAAAGEVEDYVVEGPIQEPFECVSGEPGLLFQYASGGDPTDMHAIDLVTGGQAPPVTADGYSINGVGYNVLDDYVYGWSTTTQELVRVGADGSVDASITQPTGVPTTNFLVGDVDDQGHYWVLSRASGTWYDIDLATGMSTSQTAPVPDGLTAGYDWAFVPDTDTLWMIAHNADGDSFLTGLNRTTGDWTDPVELGAIGNRNATVANPLPVGAVFVDADGNLYASYNASGEIWRIDVTTGDAAFFSQGPASSNNDGARCADAPILVDFGDAPDTYGTTLGSGGPRHSVNDYDPGTNTAPLMLGATVDPENDGLPGTDADGDDTDATADEDGVTAPIIMTDGQATTVTVSTTNTTGEPATLVGWIDLNGDGDFDDAGERQEVAVPDGSMGVDFDLTFDPPAAFGDTYARFRLFPDGTDPADMLPTGPAAAGEVEDYPVEGPVLPPWECTSNAPAILVQEPGGGPTSVHLIDLLTGDYTTPHTIDGRALNGIGYNVLDDYVYGWHVGADIASSDFLRLGSDGSVEVLDYPGGYPTATADIDDNGHYWMITNPGGGTPVEWWEIDLEPGSPTYLEVLRSGPMQGGGIEDYTIPLDLVYVPGGDYLYTVVAHDTQPESALFRMSRTTGEFEFVATLNSLNGIRFGGMFADADGFLYGSYNTTGEIWRIDVNAGTATPFSDGPLSLNNDGARCAESPILADYGDAPAGYGTELADDGPRHGIPDYDEANGTAPLMLGTSIDPETDGVPSPDADGDDTTDAGDEDGVADEIVVSGGGDATVSVSATNTSGGDATLVGWIDLNGDGDFDDAGERQEVVVPAGTTGGAFVLTFGPATATGDTYARFRLFPDGTDPADMLPTGPASAGEVEDYPVTLATTEHDKELVDIVPNGDGTYTVGYELTVTRNDADGTYDLIDTLRYGDGVNIEGVTAENVTPGGIPTNVDFDGEGDPLVADDVDIAADATHVYTVEVVISIDTDTITFESSDCTLDVGESGTGLFNESAVEIDNSTITDDVCELPPAEPVVDKSVTAGPTAVGNGEYEISYQITATNAAAGEGIYTIDDELLYGDGITVVSANVANLDPGSITTDPDWDGEDDIRVVTDETIAAGTAAGPTVHTYEVVVVAEVAADITIGDADCDLQTGGGDGSGFMNEATLTTNGESSVDDDCVEPPVTAIDKELVAVIPNGDGTFTLDYEVRVSRTNDGPGYDLDDTFTYGDAVSVDSVNAVNVDPGAVPINGTFDGESDTRIATNVAINDGETHLYEVTVEVTVDGDAGSFAGSDCDLDGESGSGFSNTASATSNGSTVTDDDCEAFPLIDVEKSTVGTPTPLGGGRFEIVYEIDVINEGAADGTYDVADELLYGDGITVLGESVSNTAPGGIATNSGWDGDLDTEVVSGVAIAGATAAGPTVHTYTVTVEADVDGNLAPEAADCTLEPGEAGTGFLNHTTLTGDSGDDEDDSCPPPPVTEIDKELAEIVPMEGRRFELVYDLTVERVQGGDGTYTVRDELLLGESLTVEEVSAVNVDPGDIDTNDDFDGVDDIVVAAGKPISDGEVHHYEVIVEVTVDIGAATPGNSDCTLGQGEGGTGTMNRASVEVDGVEPDPVEDCKNFPGTTHFKDVVDGPTPLGDGNWGITYEIIVINAGAADDVYDLDDTLVFGDGIDILDQDVTNATPGDIATNPDWDGIDDVSIVTDQPIDAGTDDGPAIHTYEVDVEAHAPAGIDPAAADCDFDDGESGTGFANESTLTVGPDTETDDGCVPVPITDVDKELVDVVDNGDGTRTLDYEVVVTRTGDGPGYELTDEFAFGAPVSVESVSVTDSPAGASINDDFDGIDDTLIAADVAISDGDTHTYRLVVVVAVDEAAVTSTNSDCAVSGGEAGSGLLNHVSVVVNGEESEDEACAEIEGAGRLDIAKVVDETAAAPGDTVTYTVTATNVGTADYTADRPAELVDDMSDVIDDAAWLDDLTASSGVASYAAPELRWTGPLAVGETVTLTYAVRIRTDTAGSGSMYNTVASVLSDGNCRVDQLGSGRQAAWAVLSSECETLTSIRLPAPPRAPRSPITPRPIPVTG